MSTYQSSYVGALIDGFDTAADVLDDTTLTYITGSDFSVVAGDKVRVWGDGFVYDVADASATDHHVTTAGGIKLYALPIVSATGNSFTAKQFGAIDGTDVTDALQAAIDAALYNVNRVGEYMQDVLIDVHEGTLSRTIHCSYGGDSYKTINVFGLGSLAGSGDNVDAHAGTALTFTPTSGPAFSIQGGRKPKLGGFSVRGAAYDDLAALKPAGGSEDFLTPENYDPKTWDAALVAAGVTPNRRYAPYAGVVIDPRSGDRPANLTISAMTAASPAVITTSTDHNLNTNSPEAVVISGLAAQGIADGEYFAVQLTATTAELWNLDWTATTGTGTGTGALAFPYYDDPAYPAIEGALDPDTEKKRTSQFVVEDAVFEGFEVATVINPGTLGSNGDFGEFRHVNVEHCKYAHATCHSNARINRYDQCNVFGILAAFVNYQFGVGTGYINAYVLGLGGGYMVKWFDISATSRTGPMTFDNCHPEGVGMIGSTKGSGTSAAPIVFVNSVVKFNQTHGVPRTLLDNVGGEPIPVHFVGGVIEAAHILSMQSDNVQLYGTHLLLPVSAAKEYMARAINNAPLAAMRSRQFGKLGQWTQPRLDLDDGQVDETILHGPGLTMTGRDYGLPAGAAIVARDARNEAACMPVSVPPFSFEIATSSRSYGATPISGRTVTFTNNYGSSRLWQNGVSNGAVLVDPIDGVVMVVRSVDYSTKEIICTLESNWYDNGVDPAGLFDTGWDHTANSWHVIRTDLYTPPSRIFGTFTSGSATITDVYSVGPADEGDYGLAIGDALASRYGPAGVYLNDDTEITAIDTVANTITTNKTARRSAAEVPLDFWIRAAPANEPDL